MYAKHGNLVDPDAFGDKASTKNLESRWQVIQGHPFWDHWKADEGLDITVCGLLSEILKDFENPI